MADLYAVTDPDVLELYKERIYADTREAYHHLGYAVSALKGIASEPLPDPVRWAQIALTYMGERATPLPDEGMPCG